MEMLVRMLDLKADVTSNFSDVKANDYYYNALGIVKTLGIANGMGDNKFNPRDFISRQDMMVLMSRAMDVTGKLTLSGTATDLNGFKDTAKRRALRDQRRGGIGQCGYRERQQLVAEPDGSSDESGNRANDLLALSDVAAKQAAFKPSGGSGARQAPCLSLERPVAKIRYFLHRRMDGLPKT